MLLGAGASADAGVPVTTDMTLRMHELVEKSIFPVDLEIYRYVVGGLIFRQAVRGESPFAGVDIEALLNAVEALSERNHSEVSEFVGSWHWRTAALDRSRGLYPALQELERQIRSMMVEALATSLRENPRGMFTAQEISAAVRPTRSSEPFAPTRSPGELVVRHVDETLRNWVEILRSPTEEDQERITPALQAALNEAAAHGDGSAFRTVLSRLKKYLSHLVWIEDPGRVEYLSAIIHASEKRGRLVVASLNYDNAIELAADSLGTKVFRGVESWTWGSEIKCPARGLSLLKLHGSIDWTIGSTSKPDSQQVGKLRVVRPDSVASAGHVPAVVFGGKSKVAAEGPFLDLLMAFRRELSRADELVVIGYSFRDEHVNQQIAHWFSGGMARRIRILEKRSESLVAPFARQLTSVGGPRVTVIEGAAKTTIQELFK